VTTKTNLSLGKSGPSVFPIALGCMGMGADSWYGDSDEAESIATIHEALERGVNLIDTGDFYSLGKNELLVGKALRGRRDRALLSVKFGALRGPDGAYLGYDAPPAAVKNFLAHSLSRLGVDHIDIYRPARLDPNVPLEDTVGAIADMVGRTNVEQRVKGLQYQCLVLVLTWRSRAASWLSAARSGPRVSLA
jgi:aryl-alcohol dehydrogenase-like predicted oxidoreductase